PAHRHRPPRRPRRSRQLGAEETRARAAHADRGQHRALAQIVAAAAGRRDGQGHAADPYDQAAEAKAGQTSHRPLSGYRGRRRAPGRPLLGAPGLGSMGFAIDSPSPAPPQKARAERGKPLALSVSQALALPDSKVKRPPPLPPPAA